MGAEIAAEAVVIGAVDYGDADRVVTLFTRERGKVAAFAAGARRSRRRFAGALEPFTRLSVRLREGRGDLLFLDSCSVLAGHGGLRDDLGRLGHAGHAAELCRELVRDHEAHPALFEDLARYLAELERAPARPEDLLAFELAALGHAGFAPRIGQCAVCGDAVRGDALFDPDHGGALCARDQAAAGRGALEAGAAELAALAGLQAKGPFAGVAVLDAGVRARARTLVRRFTRHALGREPRSLAFLEQMGIEG